MHAQGVPVNGHFWNGAQLPHTDTQVLKSPLLQYSLCVSVCVCVCLKLIERARSNQGNTLSVF